MPPTWTQLKLTSGREKDGIVKGRRPENVPRLRSDAVLSINPRVRYAQWAKNHEYRKYKLTGVKRILANYQSFVVTTAHPKVPGEVQDPTGVGNDNFDAGKVVFKFGYPVLHLHRLREPISITDMKQYGLSIPQGYVYATTKLVKDFPLDEIIEIF